MTAETALSRVEDIRDTFRDVLEWKKLFYGEKSMGVAPLLCIYTKNPLEWANEISWVFITTSISHSIGAPPISLAHTILQLILKSHRDRESSCRKYLSIAGNAPSIINA